MDLVVIAGLATAFNFLIIIWKFSKERHLDASLDLLIFVAIALLFKGTVTGLQIGMIASMIVSIYLLIKPPKLDFLKDLI
jgi:hypothetical protein